MLSQGFDPDGFLFRGFIDFASHALMGAAFVYTGARIAPKHGQIVAYSLGVNVGIKPVPGSE